MAAVLLDSSILIDLLRGRPGAIARLRSLREAGDLPYVCAINVEEVERGVRSVAESEAAGRLFEGMFVATLGRVEGVRAGAWRREFSQRGRTLSQADCLVAAAAHSVGRRLATGNPKDFPMSELVVDHWPVGA